jgi:uncharacterized protein
MKKLSSILYLLTISLFPVVFPATSRADVEEDVRTLVLGGRPQDPSQALGMLLIYADEGEATCQYALGVVYFKGSALKRNYTKAFEYMKLAADQGHIPALRNLGTFYYRGHGVEKDINKGLSLWKIAADAGDSDAMLFFGDTYYTGDSGTPKDLTLGAHYILKAAESGSDLAKRVADKYGIKK